MYKLLAGRKDRLRNAWHGNIAFLFVQFAKKNYGKFEGAKLSNEYICLFFTYLRSQAITNMASTNIFAGTGILVVFFFLLVQFAKKNWGKIRGRKIVKCRHLPFVF